MRPQVGSDTWQNNVPRQERMRNDPGTVSSDYSTSPAPSSNASYSTDFSRNADRESRQLPSVAAYHRALAELAASSRINQQANCIDHQQAKPDAQNSGRGAAFQRAGSEMNAASGHGQKPTTDGDQLLTAPRVSLSPLDRVSFSVIICLDATARNPKQW